MPAEHTFSALPELFDELPVGCHILDREGRILRVNQMEREMLGYSADEMTGRRIWEFVRAEEQSDFEQAVRRKILGEPCGNDLCRSYVKRDGAIVPVLIQDRLLRV